MLLVCYFSRALFLVCRNFYSVKFSVVLGSKSDDSGGLSMQSSWAVYLQMTRCFIWYPDNETFSSTHQFTKNYYIVYVINKYLTFACLAKVS